LAKNELIKHGKVNKSNIFNLPFVKIIDIIDSITQETSETKIVGKPSIHTHCATFGLGGGRDECWNIDCRLSAVQDMARFAALYSDKVYIHNFLADFSPTWGHPPEEDNADFRHEISNDLEVLLHLKPLIDIERVILFTPTKMLCPYCYAKLVFGKGAEKRLERAQKLLERELFKKTSVNIYKDEEGFATSYNTGTGYFRHPAHIQPIDPIPEPITFHPNLVQRIESGEVISLTPSQVKEFGLQLEMATEVFPSFRYQLSVSEAIGTSFLTDREVDTRILSFMSDKDKYDNRNNIAGKYLKTIVPFAEDVPISKLAKLREREELSFLKFRSALDQVLDEFVSEDNSFSERHAIALYDDVIAPEIASLERKVEKAKRDLIMTPIISGIGTSAIISFGLYSGMISAELKEVAGALGLTKVIYDTVTQSIKNMDIQKDIRPEKFYFLWKVLHSK